MKTKHFLLVALTIFICLSFKLKETKSKSDFNAVATPVVVDYAKLLGKDVDSPEAKAFISTLKGDKEVNRDAPNYPHLMYLDEGVEIIVNKDFYIHAIFICNPNIFYKTAFKGYLPYDLKMTDTREQIETKLGKGEVVEGYSSVECCWKTKNIQINYKKKGIDDMQNKIETIQFRTWEK